MLLRTQSYGVNVVSEDAAAGGGRLAAERCRGLGADRPRQQQRAKMRDPFGPDVFQLLAAHPEQRRDVDQSGIRCPWCQPQLMNLAVAAIRALSSGHDCEDDRSAAVALLEPIGITRSVHMRHQWKREMRVTVHVSGAVLSYDVSCAVSGGTALARRWLANAVPMKCSYNEASRRFVM